MKILSAKQLKQADQITIERQGIRSVDLMERAAAALSDQLMIDYPFSDEFAILCGSGNNGGDGLALARLLYQEGKTVRCLLIESAHYSPDNRTNLERLGKVGLQIERINKSSDLSFGKDEILIDALFGVGLSRPLDRDWLSMTEQWNSLQNLKIAIDLPSGLLPDEPTPMEAPVFASQMTYTFHSPKVALLMPKNQLYTADFKIVDIQLISEDQDNFSNDYYFVQKHLIQSYMPQNNRFSHKGTFGHALIIGGSYGKMGAVILSSKATLRTGCGLITAYVPQAGCVIVQTAFPEAMVHPDEDGNVITQFPKDIKQYSAIGLGCGMGKSSSTQKAFGEFLQLISSLKDKPKLVLDADALNILAENPGWVAWLPQYSVLTPHPKELERLIGRWTDDWEKIKKAKAFAVAHCIVLLIKGANTIIILPTGEVFFNSTGNWGMATGGSGDVLTGIITSLLAQGWTSDRAAIAGVFLHGLSADLAVFDIHPKSLVASDIINYLSEAWRQID